MRGGRLCADRLQSRLRAGRQRVRLQSEHLLRVGLPGLHHGVCERRGDLQRWHLHVRLLQIRVPPRWRLVRRGLVHGLDPQPGRDRRRLRRRLRGAGTPVRGWRGLLGAGGLRKPALRRRGMRELRGRDACLQQRLRLEYEHELVRNELHALSGAGGSKRALDVRRDELRQRVRQRLHPEGRSLHREHGQLLRRRLRELHRRIRSRMVVLRRKLRVPDQELSALIGLPQGRVAPSRWRRRAILQHGSAPLRASERPWREESAPAPDPSCWRASAGAPRATRRGIGRRRRIRRARTRLPTAAGISAPGCARPSADPARGRRTGANRSRLPSAAR